MASLSRIRLAFLLVPAFVAGFSFALGVNTGKTTTMGSLRGGTLGTASNISYQTGRHGLQTYYTQNLQSYGGKMYQLPARAKTPTSGLIKGLRNLLKSPVGKANIGLIVGAWALDGILEETGFYKSDDGYYINKPIVFPIKDSVVVIDKIVQHFSTFDEACASCINCKPNMYFRFIGFSAGRPAGFCKEPVTGAGVSVFQIVDCPIGTILSEFGCLKNQLMPITDNDIDAINFDNWTPPANVPNTAVEQVYPYISPADTTIELDPITVTAPAETVTAADGSVKQRTTTETISVSSPNTDPALQVSVKTTTNTYQDGLLTDTQTTTTTTDATAASPNQTQQHQLTDCAFFPTLCKWIDWTQQPPPSDADLPALIPVTDLENIEQKKDVRFGTAVCPTPSKIYIATIGKTVEFDWAFICQIAEKIKYFILAAAYLMAIRINLGVLRG